jgi:hypothetical protein
MPPDEEPASPFDILGRICREAGPRPAGSAAEEKAAKMIASMLEGWGVETSIQSFPVVPRTLQILLGLSVAVYLVSLPVFFLLPPVSVVLLAFLPGLFFPHMVFGYNQVDMFFPKKPSWNVIGKIRPAGERGKLLIFSAHHDSAWRMPLLDRSTYKIAIALFPVFALSVLALLAFSCWKTFVLLGMEGAFPAPPAVEIAVLAFCGAGAVAGIALALGLLRADAVMGANDNLGSVAVIMALARELVQARPAGTEVWVLSFGAEELGLLGSRFFVRRSAGALRGSLTVNLESLGQSGKLHALTGELLAWVFHSPQVIDLLNRAAGQTGIEMRRKFLPVGLTDAASFRRVGLTAGTVLRLRDDGYPDHYHTPGDDLSSIKPENLDEALALCLKIVELVEKDARGRPPAIVNAG